VDELASDFVPRPLMTADASMSHAGPLWQANSQSKRSRGDEDYLNARMQMTQIQDENYEPLYNRFCSVCCQIFSTSKLLDSVARGDDIPRGFQERLPHHPTQQALLKSVQSGCHFCSLLYVTCCYSTFDRPDYLPGGQQSLNLEVLGHDSLYASLHSAQENASTLCLRALDTLPLQAAAPQKRPISTNNTSSEATLELARQWLQACTSNHQECSMQGSIPPGGPKRVLRLSGPISSPHIHLAPLTSSYAPEYLTLSHRWGDKSHQTLSKHNYNAFLKNMAFSHLPQTFRDAVQITMRLGYKALWIDALCIIQDDLLDKQGEIPRMGVIYGNSVCTIAALVSRGSSEGCFADRKPLSRVACHFKTATGGLMTCGKARAEFMERQLFLRGYRDIQDAPVLHSRGWVVQERALSPRTLYFSNTGVYWECCRITMFEADEVEDESPGADSLKAALSKVLRDYDEYARQISSDRISVRQAHVGSWHDVWWKLVSTYTRASLTDLTDRWSAISGISSVFERGVNSSLFVGLWRLRIMNDMLWEAGFAMMSQDRHRLNNGYPTWSWLSINGPASLDNHARELTPELCVARILAESCITGSAGAQNVFSGYVSKYSLTIEAPMARLPKPKRGLHSDERLAADWTISQVLDHIGEGHWTADVPLDKTQLKRRQGSEEDWAAQWSEQEDLWALQWTKYRNVVRFLIVKPSFADPKAWYRVGMYNRWRREYDGVDLGEMREIGPRMRIELY